MVELVAEVGYPTVRVRDLAHLAGVSTRTVYRRVGPVQDCFASTYAALARCAVEEAEAALRNTENSEKGLRLAVGRLLRLIIENPKEARLALVDAYAAGPVMRERIGRAIGEFERLLADALARTPDPTHVAKGISVGIVHVARARLMSGRVPDAPGEDPVAVVADKVGDWVLSLRDAPAATAISEDSDPLPKLPNMQPHSSFATTLRGQAGDERRRILTATARLAAAEGYAALTVPKIRAEAGVSRRGGFDAYFTGVDDCFLAMIEALMVGAIVESEQLIATAGDWQRGVERAVLTLCTDIARNQSLAALAFVDVLAPGLEGLCCKQRMIAAAATRGRAAAPPAWRPDEVSAEASVAALWQIIETELGAGRGAELPRLAPTLAYILIRPGTHPS